jgi:hypothetical protein
MGLLPNFGKNRVPSASLQMNDSNLLPSNRIARLSERDLISAIIGDF